MSLRFAPLSRTDDREGFSCGVPALDEYFRRLARQDMEKKAATVIAARASDDPAAIAGFYTLSAAAIPLPSLPEEMKRRLPRYADIPAVRLGRLAVSRDLQGGGVGSLLLLDAIRRSCRSELAWAALLVDAKDEKAAAFYRRFHFTAFPEACLKLVLSRRQAEVLVAAIPPRRPAPPI